METVVLVQLGRRNPADPVPQAPCLNHWLSKCNTLGIQVCERYMFWGPRVEIYYVFWAIWICRDMGKQIFKASASDLLGGLDPGNLHKLKP